jgi:hexosaminidase
MKIKIFRIFVSYLLIPRMKRITIILLLVVATMMQAAAVPQITPAPLTYEAKEGTCGIANLRYLSADWKRIDKELIATAVSAALPDIQFVDVARKKTCVGQSVDETIKLRLDKSIPSEGYDLTVAPGNVTILANDNAGFFYALQSLSQLIQSGNGSIPCCHVSDAPRFSYRGIMIDVSRHFRSIQFLKRQIDLLSQYKINRLHLHLTDAAGWRIEIKRYPRLTQYAAWRPQAIWKDWNVNRDYCDISDANASGGYYTQEELRDLVAYAERHAITIIPEIEMPSHSEEVTTAYPEVSCTHRPKQSDFCVGNDTTFEFLENVLDEVMDIFPSHYIHIGGDEAGKGAWRNCELCQRRMTEEGLKDVDELQSYMFHRIERYVNSKGRDILGWDEILEGGLAPNATVMSWRGIGGGIAAAKTAHNVVMSPGEYCYFDAYQDAPYSQPEAMGGYLPLQKVYGYEPVPEELSADMAKYIIGVQGNLWCEYIPTDQQAEYMLYPRAIALAEVAWSSPQRKSWSDFKERVLAILPRIQAAGYGCFDYSREVGNRPESFSEITHKAVGKPVEFRVPYWSNYPANGDKTLTDGVRGGWNYNDRRWLAFVGSPRMDVVIDLEAMTQISSVAADFMQIVGPEVFLPATVVISVSDDGDNYRTLTKICNNVTRDEPILFRNFGWEGSERCRYIRYQADADMQIGGVLFTDEIVVE